MLVKLLTTISITDVYIAQAMLEFTQFSLFPGVQFERKMVFLHLRKVR